MADGLRVRKSQLNSSSEQLMNEYEDEIDALSRDFDHHKYKVISRQVCCCVSAG